MGITHGVFSEAAAFICLHLRELQISWVSKYRELFECISVTVRYSQVVVVTRQRQHVLFTPAATLYLLGVFSQHRDFPARRHSVLSFPCFDVVTG